ncbi:MAG: Xaa-Pro dipeptidase [Naasia sp.]|nr:Xaa-Pro dipeptidase [Naasia sp.]
MTPANEWLVAGSVVVGDGSPPLLRHAVRLEGGMIAEVRPARSAPSGAIDLGEATIAPGFVDAHVHLLFDYQADHEVTRAAVVGSSRDRLIATAIRHGLECLRAGVTTVRDLGDRDRIVGSVRDLINEGVVPGPRIHTAGTPVTITAGHLGWLGGLADSRDELVRLTRTLVGEGSDVIKVMASGGNMTRESNKRLPQYTVDELKLVVFEAHRGGKPVAAHALNSEAVRRSIAAGIDTIEHCGWVNEQGEPDLTEEDLVAMRAAGSVATLTMAGIARQLLPDPDDADQVARQVALSTSRSGGDLYADHQWARRLIEAGIGVVIASDAGVRFTPFSGFRDTVRCGMVALGTDAAGAISLATLAGARALREDHRLGSVEAGKLADLIVLEGVITEGSRTIGAIREVRKEGRVVARAGVTAW